MANAPGGQTGHPWAHRVVKLIIDWILAVTVNDYKYIVTVDSDF
jgi:hypothetical protein